jgi:hypothetical protein
MKKEFIVSRIEASQDGSPYIYITFNDANDYKSGERQQQNPSGTNVMAFTSPEDLMANISKMMGSGSGPAGMTDSPVIRMSMNEYEDMGIKVGDKATIEITKLDNSGI